MKNIKLNKKFGIIASSLLLVGFILTMAIQFTANPIKKTYDSVVGVSWYNNITGGQGTGFVVDAKNGIIVTNYHVIEGAISGTPETDVKVTFIRSHDPMNVDNESVVAEVIGYDIEIDIAVLRVEPIEIDVRKVSDVKWDVNYKTGDDIWVIGHPLGQYWSVSKGIISNTFRRGYDQNGLRYFQRLIQIDAAINSGNSGGPVFDKYGNVSGIAVALISPSGSFAGIGQVIEASLAKVVVEHILKYGEYKRPSFGIEFDVLSNLNDTPVITEVIKGGTLDGFAQEGDKFLRLNGWKLSTISEVYYFLGYLHIGDYADITVLRNGIEITKRVVIKGEL